jgi:transcriptional regulator with XRE-family HTH domain
MMNSTALDKINNISAELESIKLQLATQQEPLLTIVADSSREHEIRREGFIKINQKLWERIGTKYKSWREGKQFTKAKVSRELGIASSTLSKFENGKPCRCAKAIEKAYDLLIQKFESKDLNDALFVMYGRNSDYSGKIYNLAQYTHAVKLDIHNIRQDAEGDAERLEMVRATLIRIVNCACEVLDDMPTQEETKEMAQVFDFKPKQVN